MWKVRNSNNDKSYGTMRHVRRAAIWTLGQNQKKPKWVDAYVNGDIVPKY